MSARFEILFHDPGFVLLRSETRKDVTHLLEREHGKWVCHCENAERSRNKLCKHVFYLNGMSPEVSKRDARKIEQMWQGSTSKARERSFREHPWIYYGVERALGRELSFS